MGKRNPPLESPVALRLNGIPSPLLEQPFEEGFVRDPLGGWRPLVDDGLSALDSEAAQLHDAFDARIFGTPERYWEQLRGLSPVVHKVLTEGGLNSECNISREAFEQFVAQLADWPELNRFLYLFDCRKLVSAVQECTKEVTELTGEFYRILNCEPFFIYPGTPDDGVRWSTSPSVTKLTATLGFIFVRLHSLLDYLSKLAREAESLRGDFKKYPKLQSSGFIFGHRARLRLNGAPGTIFESCADVIQEVELLRNFIIHDGLLDDIPKAYEIIRGGRAIERYVLMPDRQGNRFERFKNRHLFYGREDKINLRLAQLIRRFISREIRTVAEIRLILRSA